jgi:hypothetical protein
MTIAAEMLFKRSLSPLAAVSLLLAAVVGCSSQGSPPPEGQLQIEKVAGWYQFYRSRHGGKTAPNEEALTSFIADELKQRGETVPSDLFISPRDKQKYVVSYGKPISTNPERNVAAYEKEGYGGKKLVAFESKWSKEVDDAELQSLLSGK